MIGLTAAVGVGVVVGIVVGAAGNELVSDGGPVRVDSAQERGGIFPGQDQDGSRGDSQEQDGSQNGDSGIPPGWSANGQDDRVSAGNTGQDRSGSHAPDTNGSHSRSGAS